ncbi:MAG: TetR/AcrR family transcriptional regulator [Pseudomonadota bacterium]
MPKIVDKEEVRNKIMDAAMSVYADVGYHAATISGVAKAAGMGKGTLYLYFESKEALTVSLADRIFTGMEEAFMGEAHCDTLEAFGEKLKATMDIPAERAGFVRVFFEVFGPSFASEEFVKSVAGFFDRLGAYYADQIKMLQEAEEVSQNIDAAVAGRSLAAMVDGVILHRGLFAISVRRHRAMIKEAISMFADGLRA